MKSFRIHILTSFLACLSLTSCKTIDFEDDHSSTEITAVEKSLNIPTRWTQENVNTGLHIDGWVAALDNTILTELVNEALENNKDILLLRANRDRSRALAKQARASLFPILNAFATLNNRDSRTTVNVDNYAFGVEANWELDIWGKSHFAAEAVQLDYLSFESTLKFAQYSLAADVARAYISLNEVEALITLQKRIYHSLVETNRVVQVQFNYGVANQQDLSLIKSDVTNAKNNLKILEISKRNFERSLEVLLGRYPSADIALSGASLTIPDLPEIGIPINLLKRRPDIIAANYQILAAYNNMQQAHRETLPDITITGIIGQASSSTSSIFNSQNLFQQIISSLVIPVFDGGSNKATKDVRVAELNAKFEIYSGLILKAYEEAEVALDTYVTLKIRKSDLQSSIQEARNALRVSQLRFEVGESELLDVLTIQQRLFRFEAEMISLEKEQIFAYIDLNLALGGSWKP